MSEFVPARPECRVCANGFLEFWISDARGGVFLECAECMTAYDDPSLAKSFRVAGIAQAHRAATVDEIVAAGWQEWIASR